MTTEAIQTATLVEIVPTKVWIESDLWGARHVMLQHQVEGEKPFCYCTFHYNWRYTSNGGTMAAAEAVARSLGAADPIEHKARPIELQELK